ncbi:triosephosphate isomerase [Solidesulfovibrio carbinoliphilus subsp. oakridgensis]|uniref:Triosephosphate isomerase n=1 Tax=Solidesulfovibrio carbinoliphilus subsp. oakridgensis TaxID=694327 RepID=G7Q671_9BACT|nr:triose-phosphate isomerase [Solidesulfovibrio carbinoliphilus]EHJ47087.1 triosephosphate isomerase [Solidesulfovibrio carbinoliphilus subsp. oakridgensis]
MKKLMAANWKMYKLAAEAGATASALAGKLDGRLPRDREVLVIPPFTALAATAKALAGQPGFSLGGQNFYPSKQGAFTGEIAPEMLLDAGCRYALAGHSERRHILGEDDVLVGRKTAFGLTCGLSMILCVGEKVEERQAGQVEAVLTRQLAAGLADVPADVSPDALAIAYEPVWAIGTGLTAGPAEVAEAHRVVRAFLVERFRPGGAKIRILYGGSVKPGNAGELLGIDNVDGVLVGGASLEAESFAAIVTA